MADPPARDNTTERDTRRSWYTAGMGAGAAAALIALAAIAMLVANHLAHRWADPLESPALAQLKAELARNPRDEALAEQAWKLDQQLRGEYFSYLTFARRGVWVLLGCVVVFLVAARSAMACAGRLRKPAGKAGDLAQEMKTVARGRWAVATLAVLLAVGALIPAAVVVVDRLLNPPPPPPPPPASWEVVCKYWPQFRGPGGQGRSHYANIPTAWDGNTGKGVLWKQPVPLAGYSSPVVWKDRVFLTGAGKDRREVFCFDAGAGKLLWRRVVEKVPDTPGLLNEEKVYESTGRAASTPAVDDRYVYAIFANGDLACFDHEGKDVWARALGVPANMYNHAASLVVYKDLLLVQWDQGQAEELRSKLLAFDRHKGRLAWQARRPVAASWSTPALAVGPQGDQLITAASPWVISYDPAGGKELWRVKGLSGDVAASPVCADGVAYAVHEAAALLAIRTDGAGDATASSILWRGEEGLPDIASPLTDGKCVWLLTSDGLLTCYDAKTGQKVYDYDKFNQGFNASPSLVGDKLYLLSTKGDMFIASAGREFKLLHTSRLHEKCGASPAFQDGRIYIRGRKHLFCIANKPR